MDTLKMKFKLHALEFEIEGQQDIVKEEFKNFNDNILTHLLSKVNITQTPLGYTDPVVPKEKVMEIPLISTENSNDYPVLKDVKLRDLPKTETEWLLTYAFYASKYATEQFTKEDLLNLYEETDRKTDNRIANLSNNIKSIVNGLYIKSTNETNFIILPKGKTKVEEILAGKSVSKISNKKSKTKSSINKKNEVAIDEVQDHNRAKSKGNTTINFVDLKFTIVEMNSLIDYFKLKTPKGQNEEVIVVINWFIENKNAEGATIEEIKYLMKIATSNVPSALGQVLINLKGPKLNYVDKDGNGKYLLTSIGLLYVANSLPKPTK